MIDWKKMKDDIAKGIKDGLDNVKDGADSVAKKAGEISTDQQNKVKAHNLKKKIKDEIEELGAMIYNAEKQNPGSINDAPSMEFYNKIEKMSAEVKELEK